MRQPFAPFVSTTVLLRRAVAGVALLGPLSMAAMHVHAQAAVPAAGATRVLGTVRSVAGASLVVAKDDGSTVTLTLGDAVRVQQLPPGGTDIKAAQDATTADIAVGDRVLVAARAGDGGGLTASRVVLMKSSAIAQTNATRQADWQKRGSGGLVTSVDAAAKTVTIASGTRKSVVQTTDRTMFRRYAPGSVKFEDAKTGTLADIMVGDQLRVRGSKDVDTGSIAADEIVTGSFRNVAGLVASVDATAGTVTVKDLSTKKNVVVAVGADTDLRALPPEMAARFAARARATTAAVPDSGAASRPAGAPTGMPGAGRYGGGAGAGSDLSQVVPRLPKTTLAEIKPGEAVMIVGSGSSSSTVTAITLLSGVEPLLAASPTGTSSFNLSPWSLGGGGEAAAGGGTQ